jgi:hypothetical protein
MKSDDELVDKIIANDAIGSTGDAETTSLVKVINDLEAERDQLRAEIEKLKKGRECVDSEARSMAAYLNKRVNGEMLGLVDKLTALKERNLMFAADRDKVTEILIGERVARAEQNKKIAEGLVEQYAKDEPADLRQARIDETLKVINEITGVEHGVPDVKVKEGSDGTK